METNPQKAERPGKPVTFYLDEDEQRMLEELRAIDVRTISDTMRYALRQTHAARFGIPTYPTPQAQS